MKSLFTGIDSSSHTAVSSAQVIYSFFLNLFIYFIVIANIFFYKSIAWSLLSRIPYSVSVIPFPFPFPFLFPDSGFHVLVLPLNHYAVTIHTPISVVKRMMVSRFLRG